MRETVTKTDFVCIVGCFVGAIIIAMAKQDAVSVDHEGGDANNDIDTSGDIFARLKAAKAAKFTSEQYAFAMVCVFACSFLGSIILTLTRFLKNLHFTLVMFHYGWISSVILTAWLLAEYLTDPSRFPQGLRLLTYNLNQWGLLGIISILNSIAMNLETIAFQYEKSSFMSLV